ncbi:Aste57867_3193 [Aphanomyces stellatus]|uniref:Aste57867_3193 protein n=1 Tax=Aphanomyces stellatus TaxID=120398 RepID=A0A485K979_9STRA|nr:hypothetical protein As57867_003184 [Aphanomyces stellatus]VFT80367.1 Aste57867_3193 [Aphanomyces stellatus]
MPSSTPTSLPTSPQKRVVITATSQPTRFHSATVDHHDFNVHLERVYLSIGHRDLLTNAALTLQKGIHYGLVGRNGTGKSTLLQALADGLFEGISSHMRVMHVHQLAHTTLHSTSPAATDSASTDSASVLDVLLAGDKSRAIRQHHIALLETALETQSVRQTLLQLERDVTQLARSKMERVAEKRSGLRGLTARNQVLALERKIQMVDEALLAARDDMDDDVVRANAWLEALYAQDDLSSEARAREILASIGLPLAQQDTPFDVLSGGWKMRVFLAQIEFLQPDLLLLDEPTNHLDMQRIQWVQQFIATRLNDTTIVTVSHDRAFLNAVADTIIVMKTDRTLGYFAGNFDTFEKTRLDKELFNARLEAKVAAKTEALETQVAQMALRGRQSNDHKKMEAAVVKRKKLDLVGNQKNDKGHRFRLQKNRSGYYDTLRDGAKDQYIDLHLPEVWNIPLTPDISSHAILSVEKLYFAYPGTKQPLLKNINFNVHRGQRTVLMGSNGCGKSTLIQLLDQSTKMVAPVESVKIAPLANVRALTQDIVETLASESNTPLRLLGAPTEDAGRRHLARFGLRGEFVSAAPASTLSGGQAMRLALGLVTYPTSPQLLILDEPTNHLDMSSIGSLLEALKGYEGAVLVVSHDVHFLTTFEPDVVLHLSDNGTLAQLASVADGIRLARGSL